MDEKRYWHVYAEDGYESYHRSEDAAIRAARKYSRRRDVTYHVMMADIHGVSGGGRGTYVCACTGGNCYRPLARAIVALSLESEDR